MNSLPLLLTRTLQSHKIINHLLSKISITVLFNIDFDDIRLRQQLSRRSNSHYFRADTTSNCRDLIIQEKVEDAFIIFITSNQFIKFIYHILLKIPPESSHIYLFDDTLYIQHLVSDRRFRGIFDNVESLFTRMQHDIEEVRSSNQQIAGIQYILRDSTQFLWYPFFLNVLDCLQHSNVARREMIGAGQLLAMRSFISTSLSLDFARAFTSVGHLEPLFTRYFNIENGSSLSFQLFIDLILRLGRTDFAREEMIEMCRLKYTNSPVDLKKIDEFEREYDRKDAVKWYTTDSFLYRLLNNSLRLEDIDTLFKLRYYIYDLHNQLAQLQTSYIQSIPINQSILTLYRGQRMSIDELKHLQQNVGNLISMNSFLSTTSDVQAAVFFAGDGSLDMPISEISVLYQITVDTNIPHSIPFAKVKYESLFKDEDEVLFSVASVFRIDAVEQYGPLWVVNLTLINKENEK